jgi:hypothetical protein
MLREGFMVAIVAAAVLLAACSRSGSVTENASPGRKPPAANFSFLSKQPVNLTKPATKGNSFAVDLRQHDLSKTDLSQAAEALINYASWDMATKWPGGAVLCQSRGPCRPDSGAHGLPHHGRPYGGLAVCVLPAGRLELGATS